MRDFHAVIGKETRAQALEKWGGKPDILVACVGGGSNAMGLFHEFVDDADVRLIGVEAGASNWGKMGLDCLTGALAATSNSWSIWIVLTSAPAHPPLPPCTALPCAGGEGIDTPKHAATMTLGTPGVLHGSYSLLIQDEEGQVVDPHSISAG